MRNSDRRSYRYGIGSLHLPEERRGRVAGHEEVSVGQVHPRVANKHQERLAKGEPDETLSDRIVEFVGYELVEMLDDLDVSYGMVDQPPVDKPISEDLRIELASVFVEELRRLLLEMMKKGRA